MPRCQSARCFTDAAINDHRLVRPDSQSIAQLKQLCIQMSRAKNSGQTGSAALTTAYLTEFLVHVSRAYYDAPDSVKQDMTENGKINQIITYINDHITEELSLDLLSSIFYTSKYYLGRQFKQFTGLTLYQYIMKKRLIIARDMINRFVRYSLSHPRISARILAKLPFKRFKKV